MELKKKRRDDVGSVLLNKSKDGYYIKFDHDLIIQAGDRLFLEEPEVRIKRAEEAKKDGRLSETIANIIIEKTKSLPDFVKYLVIKATKP